MSAATENATSNAFEIPVPVNGSPLIDQLAELESACWVDTDNLAEFLAAPGESALFVWTQPARYPECTDVAVVLPELRAALSEGGSPRFRIGVVRAGAENDIADQYGVMRRPSLVFLRNGEYLGIVAGMLDWEVFINETKTVLAAEPSRPLRIVR